MKQERKVFHLYNKVTKEDKYFGSLKALFENTDTEITGTTSYNYFTKIQAEHETYEDDRMKIVKSILITTPKKQKANNQAG